MTTVKTKNIINMQKHKNPCIILILEKNKLYMDFQISMYKNLVFWGGKDFLAQMQNPKKSFPPQKTKFLYIEIWKSMYNSFFFQNQNDTCFFCRATFWKTNGLIPPKKSMYKIAVGKKIHVLGHTNSWKIQGPEGNPCTRIYKFRKIQGPEKNPCTRTYKFLENPRAWGKIHVLGYAISGTSKSLRENPCARNDSFGKAQGPRYIHV